MGKLAAVVLAAGPSSRLGRPKQLLHFGGISLLQHTVNAAIEAGCDPIIVVLGSNESLLRSSVADLPVTLASNEEWAAGIGTSIRIGVTTARQSDDVCAVVLLVCDQPFISAQVIQAMAALRANEKPIVAAQYDDTLGVPAIFDRSVFEELLALPDRSGAKPIILSDLKRVVAFRFRHGAIDIDTAADYERLIQTPDTGGKTS